MSSKRAIAVREATLKDIPRVIRLWRRLMRYHRPFDGHFRERRNGGMIWGDFAKKAVRSRKAHRLLVAEAGGKLVGYCLALVASSTAPPLVPYRRGMIMDMFIAPGYRGSGLGRRMFLEMKRWFKGKRLPRIEVLYVCQNKGAVAFWRRMGFRPVHQRSFLALRRR